jgi:hypothetical protein
MATRIKYPYKNLQNTVDMIGLQVKNSIKFADQWLPQYLEGPAELFWILKNNTAYVADPPGIELLQSMPSLFNDNYWGIPGAGDCDCFTIATIASCVARNIPVRMVLVGNGKQPSHVYAEVQDKGTWIPFDLVAPMYGETKPYAKKQLLGVKF